ncbi:MAG: hypothetical protein V5A68_07560 [Candidatus Thermoplasmatota archaeon]
MSLRSWIAFAYAESKSEFVPGVGIIGIGIIGNRFIPIAIKTVPSYQVVLVVSLWYDSVFFNDTYNTDRK